MGFYRPASLRLGHRRCVTLHPDTCTKLRFPPLTLHVAESDRPERVISNVTGHQLGNLPNMIQPPLLGVVNAASAVSARTLTCRAPAVPRSCSMLSVYMAVRRRPVPRLPPLEQNGCGPSTLISPA